MRDDMQRREFLGQGLAWPLQIDPRGGIALTSGEHDIEQSIQIILETAPGERVMRSTFGCRIHELVFAPHNATTRGLMKLYIEEALIQWEPRIDVHEINITSPPDRREVLLVEIKYQIKDTYDERSIIYPFYITGEQEPYE
jgi:phage baseplate assembly protein W